MKTFDAQMLVKDAFDNGGRSDTLQFGLAATGRNEPDWKNRGNPKSLGPVTVVALYRSAATQFQLYEIAKAFFANLEENGLNGSSVRERDIRVLTKKRLKPKKCDARLLWLSDRHDGTYYEFVAKHKELEVLDTATTYRVISSTNAKVFETADAILNHFYSSSAHIAARLHSFVPIQFVGAEKEFNALRKYLFDSRAVNGKPSLAPRDRSEHYFLPHIHKLMMADERDVVDGNSLSQSKADSCILSFGLKPEKSSVEVLIEGRQGREELQPLVADLIQLNAHISCEKTIVIEWVTEFRADSRKRPIFSKEPLGRNSRKWPRWPGTQCLQHISFCGKSPHGLFRL